MAFNRLNARGQESAPFELLVAVVLMGFVLVAGLNAMNALRQQQCESKVNFALEEFKTALQNVATGRGTANVRVAFEECGSGSEETECLKLVEVTEPVICNAKCSGSRSICTLLSYFSQSGPATISQSKCIDISSSTIFPSSGSECAERPGFELADLGTGCIDQGFYSLVKAPSLSSQVPIVCAYREAQ